MAPPNKCLAQRNTSCTGFRRLTSDRQRGAIPLPAANWGVPVAGSALPVVHRPLAARVERKLNMDCLYSSACVYGVTALTVAVYSIPLLFIIWRLTKTSIRTRDLVFLGMLGIIFFDPMARRTHPR